MVIRRRNKCIGENKFTNADEVGALLHSWQKGKIYYRAEIDDTVNIR